MSGYPFLLEFLVRCPMLSVTPAQCIGVDGGLLPGDEATSKEALDRLVGDGLVEQHADGRYAPSAAGYRAVMV